VSVRTLAEDANRGAVARRELSASFNYQLREQRVPKVQETGDPVTDFVTKLKLAWRIFFPDKPAAMSPKETGKQRLRMILVADRCGMSPASLSEMKRNIVKALSDFVDIENDADIEVSISNEPQLGTIYCVAIPISRVKPDAKLPAELTGDGDGVTLEWDPENFDSDPSGRFPMGT
jgi:cell division topological specificity factor MinE